MGCESNSTNATAPSPGVAPGAETIDVAAFARAYTTDPRLAQAIPGYDAPFFQAGLAGYSDAAMRLIARRHGCPACVTEALLDRTLLGGGRGFVKADLGDIAENVPGGAEDHPLIGQIMGADPDEMAAAAVKMVEQGKRPTKEYRDLRERGVSADDGADIEPGARTFAAIDVNLACPVKKIRAKARGGHWLREPEGAIEILRAVREALPPDVPTTVKMRRAFDDEPESRDRFYRIFDAAYEMGYAWVVVHGRSVQQKYVGPSDWVALRDLVRSRPDRVIMGSGDIWNAEDIFRMIAYTGLHGASVARGCIGNPWIFRQARSLMAGREPLPPTVAEQRDVLLEHFELSVAVNGERGAGLMMRKFGVRFAAHHPDSDTVRKRFIAVKTLDDWRAVLDDHYAGEPAATNA